MRTVRRKNRNKSQEGQDKSHKCRIKDKGKKVGIEDVDLIQIINQTTK